MARQKQTVWVVAAGFAAGSGRQQDVYDAVKSGGPRGMNADNVVDWLDRTKGPILDPVKAKRSVQSVLNSLRNAGFVRALGAPAAKPVPIDLPAMRAETLARLEDLLKAEYRAGGLNEESSEAYAVYAKVKPGWLGRETADGTEEMKNEARAFFRRALVELVKAVF